MVEATGRSLVEATGRSGAPPGSTGSVGRWVVAVGLLVHLLFLVSLQTHLLDPLFPEATRGHGQAADYFGIYQAGQNLLDGVSIYDSADYRQEAELRVPYFYFYRYLPPTAYVAALDVWLLPPWPAYWAWVFCNELLLGWLLFLLLRTPVGTRPRREVMAGLALAFTPFYLEQFMGQFSFLMAVFLWFPLRAELLASGANREQPPDLLTSVAERPSTPARSRWIPRSIGRFEFWAWSAAITLKTFPVLFAIVYLGERRFVRVAAAAIAVILVCLPYYLARPEDLLHFAHLNFRPLPPEIVVGRFGMSSLVHALSAHFLGASALQTIQVGPKDLFLSSIPVYFWMGAVLAVSAFVTWRARGRTLELLALWTVAFFCLYKDIWEYHHVMLLPVLFTLGLKYRARFPVVMLALLALPTPYYAIVERFGATPVPEWPWWIIVLHFGPKALVVLVLFGWIARRCLRATARGMEQRDVGQDLRASSRSGR